MHHHMHTHVCMYVCKYIHVYCTIQIRREEAVEVKIEREQSIFYFYSKNNVPPQIKTDKIIFITHSKQCTITDYIQIKTNTCEASAYAFHPATSKYLRYSQHPCTHYSNEAHLAPQISTVPELQHRQPSLLSQPTHHVQPILLHVRWVPQRWLLVGLQPERNMKEVIRGGAHTSH